MSESRKTAVFDDFKVVPYNSRDINSFLCQDFMSVYLRADKKVHRPSPLLEFSEALSFYFGRNIQQLVVFCKYISKSGNAFYCIIPNFICRRLLFELAQMQSRDLAFAKKRKLISGYTKFSGYACESVRYFWHLRLFLNKNIYMWHQVRVNVMFGILRGVLNVEESDIIICFLKWGYESEYDAMKVQIVALNDRAYN